MRPFWLHQAVEYLIGAVFISSSIQSDAPAIPAGLGVAVMLNAAFTHGPAGAFRVLHRQVHRVIDVVLIVAVLLASVQPFVALGDNARVLMAMLALVLAFVWWNTDFASREERKQRRAARKSQRARSRPSSEEVGQTAGRVVGNGINFVRRAKNNLTSDDDTGERDTSDTRK